MEKKLSICMICSYFYPKAGGCESHIYYLSENLIAMGHNVVIITMCTKGQERSGVRIMLNGLKVYYLPVPQVQTPHGRTSLFALFTTVQYFRDIFVREGIDIVHCHQAASMLSLEGLYQAQLMGFRTVFTDHSLAGFGTLYFIPLNKASKFCFKECKAMISCSHILKENMCLRGQYDPKKIYVIPHAVDTNVFRPMKIERKNPNDIIVCVVTRLNERKGVDLLINTLPILCKKYKNVSVYIAGDGEKRYQMEDMIEKNKLNSQIKLFGALENSKIPEFLNQGDIFLNPSLTEAFCIAIIEAAASGLYVVATKVGAVPEILPKDMMSLCDPNPESMFEALEEGFQKFKNVDKKKNNERIKSMYHWRISARRTEKVYEKVMKEEPSSVIQILNNQLQLGTFFGILLFIFTSFRYLVFKVLQLIKPDDEIEKTFNLDKLCKNRSKKSKKFDLLSFKDT